MIAYFGSLGHFGVFCRKFGSLYERFLVAQAVCGVNFSPILFYVKKYFPGFRITRHLTLICPDKYENVSKIKEPFGSETIQVASGVL